MGVVLAGGRGRRFGAPKADARVGGSTLAHRAVSVLTEVFDTVVVVSSLPVAPPPGVPVIPDVVADAGPMGGLHAGLVHAADAGFGGVFVLACDLPLMEARVVAAVAASWSGDGAVAAPRADAPGVETLCAAYGVGILAEIEGRLAAGDLGLQDLFASVGGKVVRVEAFEADTDAFLNVNTPADRDRAENLLARRGRDSS